MYSINEFSKKTGVPRITLYRWDKNSILCVRRDKESPYYTEEDYNHFLEVIEPNRPKLGNCRNVFNDLGNGITECLTLSGEKFYISTKDVELVKSLGRTWGAFHVKDRPELFYPVVRSGSLVVRLHDFLLQPKDGYEVDHIDRIPMNCYRSNLRVVTKSVNCYNRKVPAHKSSDLPKGVSKSKDRYFAYITVNGEKKYLGSSLDPEVAINLRREAEEKYLKGIIL